MPKRYIRRPDGTLIEDNGVSVDSSLAIAGAAADAKAVGEKFVEVTDAKAEVHLREYLDSRTDDSEYLFISRRGVHGMTPAGIQKVLRDMGKALGGKVGRSVTPHVFRHTTATQALRSGMPVEDIQALLGHANIETTMVYARTCAESVQANHKKYVV